MCGIAGFVQRSNILNFETLQKMNRAIISRGPDDEGFFFEAETGLAARRLSIIDLASGHQPLCSENEQYWITYNGEIYNFLQLREELLNQKVRLKTFSDTEVIVNLFQLEGPGFIKKLRGMFAFAIWDRTNKKIFLFRDRLGKKPLYYSFLNDGTLVFASELKALLQCPYLNRELDYQAIDYLLSLEFIPAPLTIFKNVKKLPAGHYLLYDLQNYQIRKYWEINVQQRNDDFYTLKEEFLEIFNQAVRLRMIADVPLGAFLSGGIDSSSVVAMMALNSSEPVKTFSIGFQEGSYSELPYARKIAAKYNCDHYEEIISFDVLNTYLKTVAYLDEPLSDFSNPATYLVSEIARRNVTVVLSGDGGDEVFGGYEHFIAQKIAAYLKQPLLKILLPVFNLSSALFTPREIKKGFINRYKKFIDGLNFSDLDEQFRWMQFFSQKQKKQLYHPDFLNQEYLLPLAERFPFKDYFELSKTFSAINRNLYLDLKTYLPDDIMVKVDRMSMANSLETRSPLLDHQLVEFAFSLPPDYKLRGYQTKWFFKEAMKDFLPPEIIYRQKEGFSCPIKNWLKNELRELLLETLKREKIEDWQIFNPVFIEQLIKEHFSGKENHSHLLFALLNLFLWQERFLR